jgi:hypothetical protein
MKLWSSHDAFIPWTMSVAPDKLSVNRAAFPATVPLVAEFRPGQELGSCLPGSVPIWALAKKRYYSLRHLDDPEGRGSVICSALATRHFHPPRNGDAHMTSPSRVRSENSGYSSTGAVITQRGIPPALILGAGARLPGARLVGAAIGIAAGFQLGAEGLILAESVRLRTDVGGKSHPLAGL